MNDEARDKRLEQMERTCRERGLPVTVQRRAVFEAILDHEDHPTADQIYDQIKAQLPGLSRTTVYRILEAFMALGLINRICHHRSAARFDAKVHRHHHLVCSRCETIIDLEDEPSVRVKLPDVTAFGFEIDDYFVHFHGVCAACRTKGPAGADSTSDKAASKAAQPTTSSKPQPPKQRRKKK